MGPRKYLDSRRRIPLQGRPLQPDWPTLLHLGIRAVERAIPAPFLQEAMWTGIVRQGRFTRPVLFDHPLLRRWLAKDPTPCTDYLRYQWGNLRAPEDASEALLMLAEPDCFSAGLGSHRLTTERALRSDGPDQWAVGVCHDCHRALLWLLPARADHRAWPFYDHEATPDEDTVPPTNTPREARASKLIDQTGFRS